MGFTGICNSNVFLKQIKNTITRIYIVTFCRSGGEIDPQENDDHEPNDDVKFRQNHFGFYLFFRL